MASRWQGVRFVGELRTTPRRNGDPPLLIAVDLEGGGVAGLTSSASALSAVMAGEATGDPVDAEFVPFRAPITGRGRRGRGLAGVVRRWTSL